MELFSVLRGLRVTGFDELPRVFEDGLDELGEHSLHEALAARKQVLQEGDVSPVGRQQQGHVGEVLGCGHRERCEGER